VKIGEKALLAWLDGELDEAGAQEVEQAVRADEALMDRAEAHFVTMMQIRSAFAPLLEAPFPDGAAIVAPIPAQPEAIAPEEEPPVARTSPARPSLAAGALRSIRNHGAALARSGLRRWIALALAALLGVVLGWLIFRSSPTTPIAESSGAIPVESGIIRDHDGTLVAAGTLADALENGHENDISAPVRIALSFRDKAGRICRSFDTARLAGIACRDEDGWRLRLALQRSDSAKSSSSESPFVGQAVDAMIAGDPLDAGEEQAARANGWR
jgi:hypothetical protein